jgi:hypothetical protein
MSANVDLVRSIYADWERGDFSRTDWADPEMEFMFADGPEPGCRRGIPGMVEATRTFLGAWKEVRIEAQDYRELDGERVLVLEHRTGRGKASGIEFSDAHGGGHLFQFSRGRVVRVCRLLGA